MRRQCVQGPLRGPGDEASLTLYSKTLRVIKTSMNHIRGTVAKLMTVASLCWRRDGENTVQTLYRTKGHLAGVRRLFLCQLYSDHQRSLTVGASDSTLHARCETVEKGKIMKVRWEDGSTAVFHAVWLRHNCQCSSCTTSSNQKTIDPASLDPHMTVRPRPQTESGKH